MPGSKALTSIGEETTVSGCDSRYWSSGSSRPTKTASPSRPTLPVRPICWAKEACVPGQPVTTIASKPAMSMPSSKAFVLAKARTAPVLSASSSARRSSGR